LVVIDILVSFDCVAEENKHTLGVAAPPRADRTAAKALPWPVISRLPILRLRRFPAITTRRMALFGDQKQDQDSGTEVEVEVGRLNALALPELASEVMVRGFGCDRITRIE
jgi:hypothetical protein